MTNRELIDAARRVLDRTEDEFDIHSIAEWITANVRVEVDLIGAGPFGLTSEDIENQDWLTIESRFLERWQQSGPGMETLKRGRAALSSVQRRMMMECIEIDPEWLADAERALAKVKDHGDIMPNMMGNKIKLETFLKPDFVGRLLDGAYDAKVPGSQVDEWRRGQ